VCLLRRRRGAAARRPGRPGRCWRTGMSRRGTQRSRGRRARTVVSGGRWLVDTTGDVRSAPRRRRERQPRALLVDAYGATTLALLLCVKRGSPIETALSATKGELHRLSLTAGAGELIRSDGGCALRRRRACLGAIGAHCRAGTRGRQDIMSRGALRRRSRSRSAARAGFRGCPGPGARAARPAQG